MDLDTQLELCPPSKRLLDYYKKKTAEWKERYLDLMGQLEECRILCSQYADSESELLKREAEAARLRGELGDVKKSLWLEREHVVKLVGEKDSLRLDLAVAKNRMKSVLDTFGVKECEVFQPKGIIKDTPRGKRIASNVKKIQEMGLDQGERSRIQRDEQEADSIRIKLLQAQLEEEHSLFKEEIETLLREKEESEKCWEEERKRLQHRISCLNCRLETTRKAACDKLKDKISTQEKQLDKEVALMEENEKLMRCLMICKELLGDDFPSDLDPSKPRTLRQRIHQLEKQLKAKTDTIAANLVQQSQLKSDLTQLHRTLAEEMEKAKVEKTKLQEKIDHLTTNLEKEHQRRIFDSVGFRNDIKLMRSKLQSIERKIKHECRMKKCED